jgi:hypothetical protein
LPKQLMLCIDPAPWGHVAEWLRNGLQNRVHQFNSGRGLHSHLIDMLWLIKPLGFAAGSVQVIVTETSTLAFASPSHD